MSDSLMLVLDCSIAITWILPDGAMNKKADEILNLLNNKYEAKVPTIWPLEVANVLSLAERQKKIAPVEAAEFKEFLQTLPISIDSTTSFRATGSIYSLAVSENLTVYDAAYLEIAIRDNIPIATFDKALKKAAEKHKIQVL